MRNIIFILLMIILEIVQIQAQTKTYSMNDRASIHFMKGTTIKDFETEPLGFASLDGGTSGGAGDSMFVVNQAQQLVDIMAQRMSSGVEPVILYISGTLTGLIDMVDVKRTANVSILGLGTDAKIEGFGLKIIDSENIIVRNITFANCRVEEKDALTINGSHNVWIDHCSFTDSPDIDPDRLNHDGQIDIKNGAYNVTLSNNYFTNHRTVGLMGSSVSDTGDVRMKVTYYRNWFDGTHSRHPRVRYGKAHLLNNLYTNIGGYGTGSTCQAHIMVEGNYFENTPTPVLISQVNDPGEVLSGDPAGYVKVAANYTVNSGLIVENPDGFDFNPHEFYNYTADDSQLVKSIVMENSGAGKLNITAQRESESSLLPVALTLQQNYPNPFNSMTQIVYDVPKILRIKLEVYDILGRKVDILLDEIKSIGRHKVSFDGSKFVSGVYLYKLTSADQVRIKKMILIK